MSKHICGKCKKPYISKNGSMCPDCGDKKRRATKKADTETLYPETPEKIDDGVNSEIQVQGDGEQE